MKTRLLFIVLFFHLCLSGAYSQDNMGGILDSLSFDDKSFILNTPSTNDSINNIFQRNNSDSTRALLYLNSYKNFSIYCITHYDLLACLVDGSSPGGGLNNYLLYDHQQNKGFYIHYGGGGMDYIRENENTVLLGPPFRGNIRNIIEIDENMRPVKGIIICSALDEIFMVEKGDIAIKSIFYYDKVWKEKRKIIIDEILDKGYSYKVLEGEKINFFDLSYNSFLDYMSNIKGGEDWIEEDKNREVERIVYTLLNVKIVGD